MNYLSKIKDLETYKTQFDEQKSRLKDHSSGKERDEVITEIKNILASVEQLGRKGKHLKNEIKNFLDHPNSPLGDAINERLKKTIPGPQPNISDID